MKKIIIVLSILVSSLGSNATINVVRVWDGYFQFVNPTFNGSNVTIQLGDTVEWLPLDIPTMVHTITSTNIPLGAAPFDQIWQAPADTFFQCIPTVVGFYEYECTPHAGPPYNMLGSINVIGDVTGLSGNSIIKNDLYIYPNPTTNFIYFKESVTNYTFKILTLNGKFILSGKTDDMVDISSLKSGIYLIEIVGDKPRKVKFIKQ
ncbi:MAG: T9SS type A sorting domain-containing protein [Crocinitomicaceae bacterium]|nr:T9SS type A sorting domain-containing protein [Crocinitomicaceae bacterium]